jgi:hypothetical protein
MEDIVLPPSFDYWNENLVHDSLSLFYEIRNKYEEVIRSPNPYNLFIGTKKRLKHYYILGA